LGANVTAEAAGGPWRPGQGPRGMEGRVEESEGRSGARGVAEKWAV
jgi:hypothetical protein